MRNKFVNHLIEDVEIEYEYHPRIFWVGFLTFMFLFFIVQSYVAQPRLLQYLFYDLWELFLLFIPLIFIFWSKKTRNLLIFGGIYLVISLLMWFGVLNFIKPAYGTLFFICALWFLGDWFNIKKFGKSVFSELLKGNYYLAFGLFISTIIIGAIVEIINIPFRIWWYQWPFPSIELMGLPIIMIAFGWLPWVLAMFVFLYPFALQKPKKFKRKI